MISTNDILLKPAIGYARTAGSPGPKSNDALAAQERQVEAAARAGGYRIVHWFEDAPSGSSLLGRRGLSECLAYFSEVPQGQRLYVSDHTRIARDLMAVFTVENRLAQLGVELVSVAQIEGGAR